MTSFILLFKTSNQSSMDMNCTHRDLQEDCDNDDRIGTIYEPVFFMHENYMLYVTTNHKRSWTQWRMRYLKEIYEILMIYWLHIFEKVWNLSCDKNLAKMYNALKWWTACKYSRTPLVRPPCLHQKSGLSRGVAFRQG